MATVQSDIFKPTKFGGKYTVTLIPGDGIGAEVAESVKTIFKADNIPIEWEQVDVSGVETGDKHSEELFRESIASLKRNKLGLKGTYISFSALDLPFFYIFISSQAFSTPLLNVPGINPLMWPSGKNSTFTLRSSSLRTSPATRPDMTTSIYASSEKTPKENIPDWNINRSTGWWNRSRSSLVQRANGSQNSHSVSRWPIIARKSLASTRRIS